jgi:hypothetical protein
MTVVETPLYLRKAAALLDDYEREALVTFVSSAPEAGDIVPESEECGSFVGRPRAKASVAGCA